MSFFGFTTKNSLEKVNEIINETTNKQQIDLTIKTINKVIEFKDTELQKYIMIDLNDFFNPCYGNIRPKQLIINLTNYNQNIIKDCIFSYIHTPLTINTLNDFKRCDLTIQKKFDKNLEYIINTPYITCCQTDENNNIIDIDISQITNVNLLPNRKIPLSLGSISLLLSRYTQGNCSIEISLTLKYLFKPY